MFLYTNLDRQTHIGARVQRHVPTAALYIRAQTTSPKFLPLPLPPPKKDPAKDSDEEDLQDDGNTNSPDAEWATASEACAGGGGGGDDERPECDDSLKGSNGSSGGSSSSALVPTTLRSGSRGGSSRGSVGGSSGDRRPGERCSTADPAGRRGQKKGRSPAKRRMSMSMVLPEGPVRRHRYQPPPTVHSYLNRMNEAVRARERVKGGDVYLVSVGK